MPTIITAYEDKPSIERLEKLILGKNPEVNFTHGIAADIRYIGIENALWVQRVQSWFQLRWRTPVTPIKTLFEGLCRICAQKKSDDTSCIAARREKRDACFWAVAPWLLS